MSLLDRHAVSRGAAIGLLLIVVISALRVVVDRNVNDFDHSNWAPLFAVAVFLVYVTAGFVAARIAGDAPLSNGIVAAIGGFVLWLPVRIAIWALRESSEGLFSGRDPVFSPARILGQIVFAALFGAIGGLLAARRARGKSRPSDAPTS